MTKINLIVMDIKKTLLFTLLIISVSVSSQKKLQLITPQIASKLSSFCNATPRAYSICANVIMKHGIDSYKEIDIIVNSLRSHIAITEEFIIQLYSMYGIDNTYFSLKSWLTLSEIKICENVWELENEKRQFEIELKRTNWNLEMIERIDSGYIFSESEWSKPPIIPNDSTIEDDTIFCVRLSPIDTEFDVLIDTFGQIKLEYLSDTAKNVDLKIIEILNKLKIIPAKIKMYDSERNFFNSIISRVHLKIKETFTLSNEGYFFYRKSKKLPLISFESSSSSNLDKNIEYKISEVLDENINTQSLKNNLSYKVLVYKYLRDIRISYSGSNIMTFNLESRRDHMNGLVTLSSNIMTFNLEPIYKIEVRNSFSETKFILWSR